MSSWKSPANKGFWTLQKSCRGTGGTPQEIGAHTALAKDLDSNPITLIRCLRTTCNSNSKGSDDSRTPELMWIDTHTQRQAHRQTWQAHSSSCLFSWICTLAMAEVFALSHRSFSEEGQDGSGVQRKKVAKPSKEGGQRCWSRQDMGKNISRCNWLGEQAAMRARTYHSLTAHPRQHVRQTEQPLWDYNKMNSSCLHLRTRPATHPFQYYCDGTIW